MSPLDQVALRKLQDAVFALSAAKGALRIAAEYRRAIDVDDAVARIAEAESGVTGLVERVEENEGR